MKRWEIRRHLEETSPFDQMLFIAILVEHLMNKGVLTDNEFMDMLKHHQELAEQIPHYE